MSNKTAKGSQDPYTNGSAYNQMQYMMLQIIKGHVNTALPVRVESVDGDGVAPVGFVSATPLITMYDGFGEIIEPTIISKLPYFRLQGGKVAIIADPIPGDIGIAVFAQQDISGLTDEPSKPNSKRSFSMADGMYIGGIRNIEPEVYIQLLQEDIINIVAPEEINNETKAFYIKCDSALVECQTCDIVSDATTITTKTADVKSTQTTIQADTSITLDTPTTYITGGLIMGKPGQTKTAKFYGNIDQDGWHKSTEDQIAGSVSQMHHVHNGVMPGSGNTDEPVK